MERNNDGNRHIIGGTEFRFPRISISFNVQDDK